MAKSQRTQSYGSNVYDIDDCQRVKLLTLNLPSLVNLSEIRTSLCFQMDYHGVCRKWASYFANLCVIENLNWVTPNSNYDSRTSIQ